MTANCKHPMGRPSACTAGAFFAGSLQVVVHEAVAGHFLILRAGAAIVGVGIDGNAAAGREDARHLDILGVHQADEVLHDDVHTVLVKRPVPAEAEEVELQALALDHAFGGEVADAYFGKVRLPGDGAEARKLGAVEAHPIVVFRMFVGKRLQHLGRIVLAVDSRVAQGFQFFILHCSFFIDKYFSRPSRRSLQAGQWPHPSPGIPL